MSLLLLLVLSVSKSICNLLVRARSCHVSHVPIHKNNFNQTEQLIFPSHPIVIYHHHQFHCKWYSLTHANMHSKKKTNKQKQKRAVEHCANLFVPNFCMCHLPNTRQIALLPLCRCDKQPAASSEHTHTQTHAYIECEFVQSVQSVYNVWFHCIIFITRFVLCI